MRKTSRRGLKDTSWNEWEESYNASSIELKRKKRLTRFQRLDYDPERQLFYQDEKRHLILDITALRAEIGELNDTLTKLYQQTQVTNQNIYQKKERELMRNPPTEKTEALQNEYDYEVKRNMRVSKEISPENVTMLQNEIQKLSGFILHNSDILEQQKERLNVVQRFIKSQKVDEQDKIINEQADRISRLKVVLERLERQEDDLNNQYTEFMSSTSNIASNRIKMQKLERKLKILDFEKLAKEENYNKTKRLYERKIQDAKEENKRKNRIKAEQEERRKFSQMMDERRKQKQEEKEKQMQERNAKSKVKTNKPPPATPRSTRTVYSIDDKDDNIMDESTEQIQRRDTVSPKFGSEFEPFTQKSKQSNTIKSEESTEINSALRTPSEPSESTEFINTPPTSSELPSAIPRNVAPPDSTKPTQKSPRKELKTNQSTTTTSFEIFSPSTANDILSDFTPKTQESTPITEPKDNNKENNTLQNEQQHNQLKLSTIIPATINNENQQNQNQNESSKIVPKDHETKQKSPEKEKANFQPHPPEQNRTTTPLKATSNQIQIPDSGEKGTGLADDEREYSYYSDYYYSD